MCKYFKMSNIYTYFSLLLQTLNVPLPPGVHVSQFGYPCSKVWTSGSQSFSDHAQPRVFFTFAAYPLL